MYVSIKQLVLVSNLDLPLPGAADAVSIKNRWYSAKGWYVQCSADTLEAKELKRKSFTVQYSPEVVQCKYHDAES